MPRSALTGSRIRERRLALGMRQADLARKAQISPSYLNLIEHNRRRIGGKLLQDIAAILGVDLTALTEGAEAQLLTALGAAASDAEHQVESARIEDFAGRFPGWAALVAAQHARIQQLERTVSTLSDRMTHDPFLSASLHEMLSTVTAIRSTSSILAGDEAIEPEWQDRFHQNLFAEARRLSEASAALLTYFDAQDGDPATLQSPQEELEAYLAQTAFHLPALEAGGAVEAELDRAEPYLTTGPARIVAAAYFQTYRSEAQILPARDLQEAVAQMGLEPLQLARRFGVPLGVVLRRLACLPQTQALPALGLVACDGSGTLTHRRPIEGFPLPRYGAACPLWPLFSALAQPGVPLRAQVRQAGPGGQAAGLGFLTYALAERAVPEAYDTAPILTSVMLIVADPLAAPQVGQEPSATLRVQELGVSCRICPSERCAARREPSILAEGY